MGQALAQKGSQSRNVREDGSLNGQ